MDLVGRHAGRRFGGEPLGVERGAVGQLPDAGRDFVRVRLIVGNPRAQRVVSGFELVDERRPRRGAQLVRGRGVDFAGRYERADLRFRVCPERRVTGALERRARGERTRLGDHEGVREARSVHAFGCRELRALDVLADRARDAVDARDIGAHVGSVVHSMKVDQRLGKARLRPVHLREHVEPAAERLRLLGALERVDPEIVGGPRLGRELRVVERALEVFDRRAAPGELRVPGGLGHVVDLVVVDFTAEDRLEQRAETQLLFVSRVEPRLEPLALRRSDVRRRRSARPRGVGSGRRIVAATAGKGRREQQSGRAAERRCEGRRHGAASVATAIPVRNGSRLERDTK